MITSPSMARNYQQGKKIGVRRPREHNGYIEEWCPVRKRYVYQHRLVIERELGRFLDKREVVHHKNHDTTDNRRGNLEYHPSHSDHMKGNHGWPKGKPRPSQQKPMVVCPVCGSEFKPKRRTLSDGTRQDTATCSMSCGQTLRYSR